METPRFVRPALFALCSAGLLSVTLAQTPPAPQAGRGGRGGAPGAPAPLPNGKKRILVIGQTKGFQHDSVPVAMANIWKWGHDTGLWEATSAATRN